MAQQLLELLGEMEQIEEGAVWFEVDEQVDVAVLAGVSAGDAAEDPSASGAIPSCDFEDAVSVLVQERTQWR